jgi:hypothetical protein
MERSTTTFKGEVFFLHKLTQKGLRSLTLIYFRKLLSNSRICSKRTFTSGVWDRTDLILISCCLGQKVAFKSVGVYMISKIYIVMKLENSLNQHCFCISGVSATADSCSFFKYIRERKTLFEQIENDSVHKLSIHEKNQRPIFSCYWIFKLLSDYCKGWLKNLLSSWAQTSTKYGQIPKTIKTSQKGKIPSS